MEMRAGLQIAERSSGDQHIGPLFGKLHLGDILRKRERYQEAEELLLEVAEGHKRSHVAKIGEYPDRCKASCALTVL